MEPAYLSNAEASARLCCQLPLMNSYSYEVLLMVLTTVFICLKGFQQFSSLNEEPALLVVCDVLASFGLIISFVLLAVFQNRLYTQRLGS